LLIKVPVGFKGEKLKTLKEVLEKYPGGINVELEVFANGQWQRLKTTTRTAQTQDLVRDLEAILDVDTADLAALSQTVNEIHARVVERSLTVSEAAGDTELDLGAISLELDAIDMDDLPAGATEAESEDWINRYINAGLLEEAIER